MGGLFYTRAKRLWTSPQRRKAPPGFCAKVPAPAPMPTPQTVGVLALVAVAAGTVDAIGGGGGLLTVPALLAVGLPPQLALGTNKGQSVFGSLAALANFARAGLVSWKRVRWTMPLGFVGALLGATVVLRLRPEVLRPLVLGLL